MEENISPTPQTSFVNAPRLQFYKILTDTERSNYIHPEISHTPPNIPLQRFEGQDFQDTITKHQIL